MFSAIRSYNSGSLQNFRNSRTSTLFPVISGRKTWVKVKTTAMAVGEKHSSACLFHSPPNTMICSECTLLNSVETRNKVSMHASQFPPGPARARENGSHLLKTAPPFCVVMRAPPVYIHAMFACAQESIRGKKALLVRAPSHTL